MVVVAVVTVVFVVVVVGFGCDLGTFRRLVSGVSERAHEDVEQQRERDRQRQIKSDGVVGRIRGVYVDRQH